MVSTGAPDCSASGWKYLCLLVCSVQWRETACLLRESCEFSTTPPASIHLP